MPPLWLPLLLGAAVIILAGFIWRRARAAQLAARRELARLEFRERRNELADEFLASAAASGKPRGLRWKTCDLHDDLLFAEDLSSGEMVALAGATISFEAIAGGDMEDVEAVGNLRSATAVFVYRDGRWASDGRTLFNLEPAQALERFAGSLTPIVPRDADSARDDRVS